MAAYIFNKEVLQNIPRELINRPCWVAWKASKIPINPLNGQNAKANSPKTWGTFDQALDAVQRFNAAGVGFQLGSGDSDIFCIDLDHCIDDDGVFTPEADSVINIMDTYTEISPSGKGAHIWGIGKKPGKKCRKGTIEIYDRNRYMTITGHSIGEPKPLRDCQGSLNAVYAQHIAPCQSSHEQPQHAHKAPLSTDIILEIAFKSKSGERIKALYSGDWIGTYDSQSQADQALCNYLAFFTQKDAGMMDALFRASGLCREKWDKMIGSTTYGQMTINKAIDDCQAVYDPDYHLAAVEEFGDQGTEKHPYADIIARIPGGYRIISGQLSKPTEDNPRALCNGVAVISEQVTKDDGADGIVYFRINAITRTREPLPSVLVQAAKFDSMSWINDAWGVRFSVLPGRAIKDYLAYAMKETGNQARIYRTIYVHSGWRMIDKSPAYLFHGGAVGIDSAEVELENETLQRYHLPLVIDDARAAVQASLNLITVHDPRVTVPLLCLTYLAPLRHILAKVHLDPTFATFMLGATQAGKSTIAALFMNHFGSFTRTTPPASFTGTANSLRRIMYLIGDAVVWVDDYFPQGNQQERRKMEGMAQALVRAAGDGADRSRMNANMTLQQGQPPRGLALITGEDLPGVNQSGIARMFIIEVKRQKEPTDLTPHQEAASSGLLAQAMRGYIEYLIQEWEVLPALLRDQYHKFKAEATQYCGTYGRLPEAVAWLMLGGYMFTRYAIGSGFMDQAYADQFMQLIRDSVRAASEGQGSRVRGENPSYLFIQALKDLNNRYGLFNIIGSFESGISLNDEAIGWYDDKYYYVNAGLAYAKVSRFFRDQGREFPISKDELIKRLGIEKAIEADPAGSLSRKKRIGNDTLRCLFMPRPILDEEE